MLKKLYLWFKGLFRKRMTIEEVYTRLSETRKLVFDNIERYFKTEEAKNYFKLLRRDDANNIIEFKIGDFRFLLQAQIIPFNRNITYKTFLRTIDMDYYPDATRYKQEYLNGLDLTTSWHQTSNFTLPKKTKSGFPGFTADIDLDWFHIVEFGKIYLEQVQNEINAKK